MPCTNHGVKCDGEECANKNVDNGLMTRIWGPSGWLFLHCISFGYPYKIDPTNPEHIEKQNDYYRFFYYLGKVMPCKYCRISYMIFYTCVFHTLCDSVLSYLKILILSLRAPYRDYFYYNN